MSNTYTKTNGSLWNLLAERFNTHNSKGCIHPDAAVNIEVGWPVFLAAIEDHANLFGKKKLKIFDFGCGAGDFCKKISDKGHAVVGMDHSRNMLDLAKERLGDKAELVHGNHRMGIFDDAGMAGHFDVVTAMHSLEWIEDIELALKNLSKLVSPGGILLFAVFPRSHVKDSLKIKDLFEDFDSKDNPYAGYANFDGVRVPVWIRTPEIFDGIMRQLGFKKVLEVEPDYPSNFFRKYKWTGSKYPEMVILAYRKNKSSKFFPQ